MRPSKPQQQKPPGEYVTAFVDALYDEKRPRTQRLADLRDNFWWLTNPWGVSRPEGRELIFAEVKRRSPRQTDQEIWAMLDKFMDAAYAEVDPGD